MWFYSNSKIRLELYITLFVNPLLNYIFDSGHIHFRLLSQAHAGRREIPKKKDRINKNHIYVRYRIFNFGYFNECHELAAEHQLHPISTNSRTQRLYYYY